MLEERTHMNGVTEPWWTGSAMAPQSKKSCLKPGEFLALKWHRDVWSWHGAKPKNCYESTTYNATELKRRAANYSVSFLGQATDWPYWVWQLEGSVIGIDGVLGNTAVECLGAAGLVRPFHAQPLVTKCRVEPTLNGWGWMNSRSTASFNGWVELEVTLSGGVG